MRKFLIIATALALACPVLSSYTPMVPIFIPMVPMYGPQGSSPSRFMDSSTRKALAAPLAPKDPAWAEAKGKPVFLERTGYMFLDDALERGFREHWPDAKWEWIAAHDLAQLRLDSAALVFGNQKIRSYYRTSEQGSCAEGWDAEKEGCSFADSASVFFLSLLRPNGTGTVLLHEVTEVRFQKESAVVAGDVVRDFHDVLLRQWRGDTTDDRRLPNGTSWQWLVAADVHRGQCPVCTLYVPWEGRTDLSASEIEAAIGRPVRLVSLDSLQVARRENRPGLYLETGGNSQEVRFLRVRSLSNGELYTAWESPYQGGPYPLEKRILGQDDFEELGHVLQGQEKRISWNASVEVVAAAETYSILGTVGFEILRGVHLFGGLGKAYPTWSEVKGSLGEWTMGLRWYPAMDLESPALKTRIVLDAQLLSQVGSSRASDGSGAWLARPKLLGCATLNYNIWEFGVGMALPIGTQYRGNWADPDMKSPWDPLAFKFGIRLEGRTWRKGCLKFWKPATSTENSNAEKRE